MIRCFLICMIFLCMLCGFRIDNIPQEAHPMDTQQSHDAIWNLLSACKVTLDEEEYIYSIDLTQEVKAMEGVRMTISGFMIPLESQKEFHHFLLSSRPSTCPYCLSGEPNEIIEVRTRAPVSWSENLIKISGVFTLINDPEMGLFFQLLDTSLL